MPADFLKINRSLQHGNSAVRLAEMLREIKELSDKLSDVRGHMTTGADFTMLESNFGVAAGQGEALSTMLANVDAILNTNAEVAGSLRRDQLNEYTGRVAGQ